MSLRGRPPALALEEPPPTALGLTADQIAARRGWIGGYRHPIDAADQNLRLRFEAKFIRGADNDCWLWAGATDGRYGHIRATKSKIMLKAHRVSYVLYVGPIPDGMEPDHTCKAKTCVNFNHLELVTHSVNVLRGPSADFNLSKTHCRNGHPFHEENTYTWISTKNGRPERRCRECARATRLRYYHRKANLL